MNEENLFFEAKWLEGENNIGYGSLPIPAKRDEEIASLLNQWLSFDGNIKQKAALKLTEGQRSTLLAFSERMASRAIREKSRNDIFLGLIALGLDGWQFDWRDNTLLLSLHYNSAELIGIEAVDIFTEAALNFSSQVQSAFALFIKRKPEDKHIKEMGYFESEDEDGFRYKRNW